MFDSVERLKREFTDKYVMVDGARPELARFQGMTGQVKTVNMSGRALVQFDAYNNIGWYDIGVDFLKVVPKPEPKPEEAKAKPKSEKPQTAADSPAVAPKPVAGGEKAPAAAPAAAGKKPSVAEMLRAQAAAKAGGAAAPAAKPTPAPAPSPTAAPTVKVEEASLKVEDPGVAATGEIPAVEKAADKAAEKKPEEAKPAGEKKKLTTAEILASLKKKP